MTGPGTAFSDSLSRLLRELILKKDKKLDRATEEISRLLGFQRAVTCLEPRISGTQAKSSSSGQWEGLGHLDL